MIRSSRVVEGRGIGSQLFANWPLGVFVVGLPAHEHSKGVGCKTLTSFVVLSIYGVKVGDEGRGLLDAIFEQLRVTRVKREGREGAVWVGSHNLTSLDYLAGVRIYPFNLVFHTVNKLGRQTRSLGLSDISRLRVVLLGVIGRHIENVVVRVQRHVVRTN